MKVVKVSEAIKVVTIRATSFDAAEETGSAAVEDGAALGNRPIHLGKPDLTVSEP